MTRDGGSYGHLRSYPRIHEEFYSDGDDNEDGPTDIWLTRIRYQYDLSRLQKFERDRRQIGQLQNAP